MKLTTYKFWTTQTPLRMDAAEATIAGIEWEWAGPQGKVRLGTEMEKVFTLETDDTRQIEAIKRCMDEWRKDGLAEAYEVDTNGQVQRYQRVYQIKGAGEKNGYTWQEVEAYDLTYATVKYALTGKKY